jgi:hypothetical protein
VCDRWCADVGNQVALKVDAPPDAARTRVQVHASLSRSLHVRLHVSGRRDGSRRFG